MKQVWSESKINGKEGHGITFKKSCGFRTSERRICFERHFFKEERFKKVIKRTNKVDLNVQSWLKDGWKKWFVEGKIDARKK